MKNMRPLLFLSFCLTLTGCDGTNYKKLFSEYIAKYPDYTGDKKTFIDDYKNNRLDLDIKFETFKGSKVETQKAHKGEKITITQESTLTNYSFAGWYKTESLEEEIQYSFVADTSVTFYAKFDPQCFSTFYVDGEVYQHLVIEDDGKVVEPENPTKAGFKFDGWLDEEGEVFNFNTLISNKSIKLYAKFSYDFWDFPAIIINTDDGEDIVSKEEYKDSKVSILNTQNDYLMNEVVAGVRGRGNTSWTFGKKPYRIKFNKKQSVLGSSYKAKSWTLIANMSDKSLLRNYVAYELGERFNGIEFSSKHELVDLYLNGEYKGVYLLCDQIQTGAGRVDINDSNETVEADGNNGYFIERDSRAPSEGVLNQDYFVFQDETYAFKTPDTESAEFISNKEVEIEYITEYMQSCWTAITDGDWSDVETLVDIDSFVDSYIIDELFANNDCGQSSCFYYKKKNGKFYKGPVWDFDIGAGNINYGMGNYDECLPNVTLHAALYNAFYEILYARNEFKILVRNKLLSYENIINDVLESLDTESSTSLYGMYHNSLERNFDKWEIMGQGIWPEPQTVVKTTTFKGQVDYLRTWLLARFEYMTEVFAE